MNLGDLTGLKARTGHRRMISASSQPILKTPFFRVSYKKPEAKCSLKHLSITALSDVCVFRCMAKSSILYQFQRVVSFLLYNLKYLIRKTILKKKN